MTDRELMQQALEAFENVAAHYGDYWEDIIAALRERLAQPEQDVWQWEEIYKDNVLIERRMKRGPDCEWEPWHTPRREWVGLTLEEIFDCTAHITRIQKDDWVATDSDLAEFAHVIEAKLKEKNA